MIEKDFFVSSVTCVTSTSMPSILLTSCEDSSHFPSVEQCTGDPDVIVHAG